MPLKLIDGVHLGFKGIRPTIRIQGGLVRDGVRVATYLHCDSCHKNFRLAKRLTVKDAVPAHLARERAAQLGWSRGEGDDDFCPACTSKRRPPIQWNSR